MDDEAATDEGHDAKAAFAPDALEGTLTALTSKFHGRYIARTLLDDGCRFLALMEMGNLKLRIVSIAFHHRFTAARGEGGEA